jgi:hypothetical protein
MENTAAKVAQQMKISARSRPSGPLRFSQRAFTGISNYEKDVPRADHRDSRFQLEIIALDRRVVN